MYVYMYIHAHTPTPPTHTNTYIDGIKRERKRERKSLRAENRSSSYNSCTCPRVDPFSMMKAKRSSRMPLTGILLCEGFLCYLSVCVEREGARVTLFYSLFRRHV